MWLCQAQQEKLCETGSVVGTPSVVGLDSPVPPIRIGPTGKVESEEEYQARMGHNAYMRFSRSIRRTSAAMSVFCSKNID